MSRKKKIECYSATIVLSEQQITEAVSKVLAERGYIVTNVELQVDTDNEVTAECSASLPKCVIVPSEKERTLNLDRELGA